MMPTVGDALGLGPHCWEQRQGEGWVWVDESGCWSLEEEDRPWVKLEEQIT